MILIPYLIMFRLLLKTHQTRTIYQSIIIGIIAALLTTGLYLLVPFATRLDYPSIFISMGSGFAFPIIVHYFDKKILDGDTNR